MMPISMQKYSIIEQIIQLNNEQALQQIAQLLQQFTQPTAIIKHPSAYPKERTVDIMSFVKPITQTLDIEQIFSRYIPPNLDKVVGVLPNDQPFEQILEELR